MALLFPLLPVRPYDPRWSVDEVGLWGEQVVLRHLWLQGMRLVAHRWIAIHGGDVDLIAVDDRLILFGEVKVRAASDQNPWRDVEDAKRQERLLAAAGQYLIETEQTCARVRFDAFLVTPDVDRPRNPRIDVREAYLSPDRVPGWQGPIEIPTHTETTS